MTTVNIDNVMIGLIFKPLIKRLIANKREIMNQENLVRVASYEQALIVISQFDGVLIVPVLVQRYQMLYSLHQREPRRHLPQDRLLQHARPAHQAQAGH